MCISPPSSYAKTRGLRMVDVSVRARALGWPARTTRRGRCVDLGLVRTSQFHSLVCLWLVPTTAPFLLWPSELHHVHSTPAATRTIIPWFTTPFPRLSECLLTRCAVSYQDVHAIRRSSQLYVPHSSGVHATASGCPSNTLVVPPSVWRSKWQTPS
jgi:hypothetical protein